jgi:hypothetical protein
MSTDNKFDDLFKKNLEDSASNAPYNEGDWDALEQMLDKRKKRGVIVYWLPALSGAAALALLFLGWWIFRQPQTQETDHKTQKAQLVKEQPKVNKSITATSSLQQVAPPNKALPTENFAFKAEKGKKSIGYKPIASRDMAIAGRDTASVTPKTKNEIYVAESQHPVAATTTTAPDKPKNNEPIAVNDIAKADSGSISSPPNKVNILRTKPRFRPQFALSVLAAPDINGVGGFQQGKVGTNEGLLFSVGISKKITISTGAIYSVKPYLTGFGNYHTPDQFNVTPINVTADCRMLDIPLNISYQVYNRQQNQISIGTGLSSYIMLHESYKFNYADPYTAGPASYTVPGVNKYFFGVLNLNATYLHQINSKFGVSLQPYLKLPLSNIGYSQVRLQTTGVALGVTWNINPYSKP